MIGVELCRAAHVRHGIGGVVSRSRVRAGGSHGLFVRELECEVRHTLPWAGRFSFGTRDVVGCFEVEPDRFVGAVQRMQRCEE
jgi:hypothetical protein